MMQQIQNNAGLINMNMAQLPNLFGQMQPNQLFSDAQTMSSTQYQSAIKQATRINPKQSKRMQKMQRKFGQPTGGENEENMYQMTQELFKPGKRKQKKFTKILRGDEGVRQIHTDRLKELERQK